jgi:hypothetical protein
MHPGGQYVRRMLSPAGLGAQLEFQATLARHFGLEATVVRNSQWGRNVFARARFDGGGGITSPEFRRLLIATLRDPLFRPFQRLALVGFWTVCAGAPRRQFERLWRWFQYRQTGYDLVAEAASHE